MVLLNSSLRYGFIVQSPLWITVLLVSFAWLLGVFGDDLPGKSSQALGLSLHITAGMLVLLLTVERLGWRVDAPPTSSIVTTATSRRLRAAALTQVALYGLLITVPLVGIAVQFARGGSLPLLDLAQIASPWAADRPLAHTLKEVHELMAHALIAAAALYAAAALLHHCVLHDRTLRRMLPAPAATTDTSRAADGL
ncbi:cytochrome b [Tardiphaga sp.]|uniref:cytochrome b n=1 Tax=Tardiphaga sp. TaxID=1926292 RepID=UPI00352ADC9C